MCAYVLDQEDTVELIAAAAMLGVGAAQPVRVIEQDDEDEKERMIKWRRRVKEEEHYPAQRTSLLSSIYVLGLHEA